MFVRIPDLLNEEILSRVDAAVAAGTFVAGAPTAGVPTRDLKNNQQLDMSGYDGRDEVLREVNQAVLRNAKVRAAVIPRRTTIPMISRYEPGMSYGWHVDNAVMAGAGGEPVRTDVACTIFLGDSESYEGGDLVVQTATGEAHVRLGRGHAFLYPATSRHCVTEVTKGERLAVVLWVQSVVADAAKRELLNDLNLAYEAVLRESPGSQGLQHIQRTHANLVRMWSDV